MELLNNDDRWLNYDFFGAKISLKTCLNLKYAGTAWVKTESVDIGEFTVVTPEDYGSTVCITAAALPQTMPS